MLLLLLFGFAFRGGITTASWRLVRFGLLLLLLSVRPPVRPTSRDRSHRTPLAMLLLSNHLPAHLLLARLLHNRLLFVDMISSPVTDRSTSGSGSCSSPRSSPLRWWTSARARCHRRRSRRCTAAPLLQVRRRRRRQRRWRWQRRRRLAQGGALPVAARTLRSSCSPARTQSCPSDCGATSEGSPCVFGERMNAVVGGCGLVCFCLSFWPPALSFP